MKVSLEQMKHAGTLSFHVNWLQWYNETTALMHERTFAADPSLGGFAHGFIDRTFNGHRALMHDGSWVRLRKVALGVFPDNERAIAVYERAGFVREGVRRMQYRSGDEFRDEVLMAWFPPGADRW